MALHKNLILNNAYKALARMGEQDLPAVPIGFRLALNRNHLRPIAEALEKTRQELLKKHELGKPKENDTPKEQTQRMNDFQADFEALMQEEVEWASPAQIEAKKFTSKDVKANDLADLVLAGIITGAEGIT